MASQHDEDLRLGEGFLLVLVVSDSMILAVSWGLVRLVA
jgi:hypothetical protein